MSEMKKISIGFIGAGNIGGVHMSVFKTLPNVELAAVTDVYQPLAESRAQEHQIGKVYATAEELLADQSIDAVIVGIPNKFHASTTIKALQAGKHVLLEKPMAINVEEARQIMRAHKESDKVVMVSHQMRWGSVVQQIKEQAEKGSFGRIYNAKAGWFRRKGIPGWGTWFTQKAESGGGPLIDIGVHLLDMSLYLMGNPKPVSVYGSTFAEFGPRKKGIGSWGKPNWNGIYDVEDLATALIKMEDGSTLSLEVSWAVNMDTDSKPFVHLMGSDGGASIIGDNGKILTEAFDKAIEIELKTPNNAESDRIRLSKHFIECILEGKEPISSAMTGFTNNLILDAIYESSRTGHEVILDWNI